jgi:chromosome segregation ATPase
MAVRTELGTGSFSTLLPWISEYRGRGSKSRAGTPAISEFSPDQIPPGLAALGPEFIARIWREALSLAAGEIQTAQARMDEEIQAKDQAILEKAAQLEQARNELAAARDEIARQKTEIETLRETTAKRTAESALLQEQSLQKETEIQKLRDSKLQGEHERAEIRENLARVQAQLGAIQPQLEALRARNERLEERLLSRLSES